MKSLWEMLCETGKRTMDSYTHTSLWQYAMEHAEK